MLKCQAGRRSPIKSIIIVSSKYSYTILIIYHHTSYTYTYIYIINIVTPQKERKTMKNPHGRTLPSPVRLHGLKPRSCIWLVVEPYPTHGKIWKIWKKLFQNTNQVLNIMMYHYFSRVFYLSILLRVVYTQWSSKKSSVLCQWIGSRDILQSNPMFNRKMYILFPAGFPFNQPIDCWWLLGSCSDNSDCRHLTVRVHRISDQGAWQGAVVQQMVPVSWAIWYQHVSTG